MSTDLEKAGVAASANQAQQYGAAAVPDGSAEKQELPLVLGLWKVSPSRLYSVGLAVFVCTFIVYRLADVIYIFTVDARFPKGLGYHYPSEEERLASVSYTRQQLLCACLHRCCVFTVVMAMILLGLFARVDAALREFLASIAQWWETSQIKACKDSCWSAISSCCAACWSPIAGCTEPLCTRCSSLKERVWNGRLSEDLSQRFGFPLSFRELVFGALYLTLITSCFFLVSAPFMYWSRMTDLKFGFSNSLTVSPAIVRKDLWDSLIGGLMFGIPSKFIYLAILQYRKGWFFLWSALIVVVILVQFNIQVIAPSLLDMNNAFPSDIFAVGRGFPWVHTQDKTSPWISLNRIYFKDPTLSSASVHFATNDKHKTPLTLTQQAAGDWAIKGAYQWNSHYAKTTSAVASDVLNGFKSASWTVDGAHSQAAVGVRSGSHLRDTLYGFARDRKIGIAEIYMVDGSHKDIRANAFVAGAGNSSVIGLFDTLFLGQRPSDAYAPAGAGSLMQLTTGDSVIEKASEIVQDVDIDEEDHDRQAPRNSAPTQAMGDDEIVSILAHELAHAHLKHLEQGMVIQAITQFITFGMIGWMAHSPVVAAALTLHAPILHVGVCAYDYVIGPPLGGIMKVFTDGHTRHNEYQADEYAARISEKYATALQTSLAKLSVNSNQDPDVPFFYEFLHHDHPAYSRRWAHIESVKQDIYGSGR